MRKRWILPADDLQRHIMRCRRLETRASVLVARVEARVPVAPERLLTCFRLTDSVSIARIHRGYEIAGVFDEQGFDRVGVERRLQRALNGADARIGWTRFPDDGVTLDVLLNKTRAALGAGADAASVRLADDVTLRPAHVVSTSEVE